MMQEHFYHVYALYMFTVQSNGGVATTHLLLVNFEDLPYPGEGPIHPVFIKMTAKDAWAVIKIISRKNRAF